MKNLFYFSVAPLRFLAVVSMAAVAVGVAGCDVAALVARPMVGGASVAASYKGLQNQSVGVLVWADKGITIDHSNVEVDLARRIEANLKLAQDADVDDVKNVKWVKAEKIARFQEDHPELEGEGMEKVAPQLPALTRLIYVEITSLSLHPTEAIDLSRGSIKANIKVYEVNGEKTKSVFTEDNISIVYPEKSPEEGVTGLNDDDVYRESMIAMAKEIATRFVTHEADAE